MPVYRTQSVDKPHPNSGSSKILEKNIRTGILKFQWGSDSKQTSLVSKHWHCSCCELLGDLFCKYFVESNVKLTIHVPSLSSK